MKKILMMASNATAFNIFCGMVNSICNFIPEDNYHFTILYQTCNNFKELMDKHGLTNRTDIEIINFDEEFGSTYHSYRKIIYSHVGGSTSLGKYLRYKDRVKQVQEMKENTEKWFKKYSPDVVLLYGDRMLSAEVIIAQVARVQGVPSIVTSYSLSKMTKSGRFKEFYRIGKKFPLFDRYVYKKCPTLFMKMEGDVYRFYDSVEAYAGLQNTCISVNPWYNGGGDAKYIAVRDREQLDDFRVGLSSKEFKEKAVLVGDIEERYIINSYIGRKEIIEKYRNKYKISGSKIIIIAIPRYAGYDRFQYPYKNYINNVDNLIRIVRQTVGSEIDILLSIHPKCIEVDYKIFEEKYGCRIVKEPLREYIGIGSLYVYEEVSSTRFWAEMLKIPSFSIERDISGRDYRDCDFRALKQFIRNSLNDDMDLAERNIETVGEIDYYTFLSTILNEEKDCSEN